MFFIYCSFHQDNPRAPTRGLSTPTSCDNIILSFLLLVWSDWFACAPRSLTRGVFYVMIYAYHVGDIVHGNGGQSAAIFVFSALWMQYVRKYLSLCDLSCGTGGPFLLPFYTEEQAHVRLGHRIGVTIRANKRALPRGRLDLLVIPSHNV